jgi:predicted methyltransferase
MRQVETILAALDLAPGERALDVGAGSGYLALLAASLVGPSGHVDLHNTPGWLAQFPNLHPEVLAEAIKPDNIGFVVAPWDGLDAVEARYDAIVMGQVFHDAVLEGADIEAMAAQLFALVGADGRVVIEDHDADPSMPVGRQAGLHRIAKTVVIEVMMEAGFKLAADVDIRAGKDNRKMNVFWPTQRGRTDRYVLTFVKPAASP